MEGTRFIEKPRIPMPMEFAQQMGKTVVCRKVEQQMYDMVESLMLDHQRRKAVLTKVPRALGKTNSITNVPKIEEDKFRLLDDSTSTL